MINRPRRNDSRAEWPKNKCRQPRGIIGWVLTMQQTDPLRRHPRKARSAIMPFCLKKDSGGVDWSDPKPTMEKAPDSFLPKRGQGRAQADQARRRRLLRPPTKPLRL
jgi:hypothetical protein